MSFVKLLFAGKPESPDDVLMRLAKAAFVAGFICAWIVLRPYSLPGQPLARFIDSLPKILGWSAPWNAYVFVGLVFAVISPFVLLHYRVSDLFKIRQRFDVHYILLPELGHAGYMPTLANLDVLRKKREDLMQDVFYRYAGSENPKINKHLIAVALDRWSWVWIIINYAVYAGVTGIVLVILGRYFEAMWCLNASYMLSLFCVFPPKGRIKAARNEVREIVNDQTRVHAIHKAFGECGIT